MKPTHLHQMKIQICKKTSLVSWKNEITFWTAKSLSLLHRRYDMHVDFDNYVTFTFNKDKHYLQTADIKLSSDVIRDITWQVFFICVKCCVILYNKELAVS